MNDVSWINTMIPELLWIALLHDAVGDHRAVEIVTGFGRDVRATSPERERTIWAAAGKFAEIPSEVLGPILRKAEQTYAAEMRTALEPIAAWYPDHPLSVASGWPAVSAQPSALAHLKSVVEVMFDRSSRSSIMVQATALWLAFDAGRLKVAADLSLAQFPKIEEYPATELSQRIGASIRASLNQMFGSPDLMASNGAWPIAFWNRGLALEPCETRDD